MCCHHWIKNILRKHIYGILIKNISNYNIQQIVFYINTYFSFLILHYQFFLSCFILLILLLLISFFFLCWRYFDLFIASFYHLRRVFTALIFFFFFHMWLFDKSVCLYTGQTYCCLWNLIFGKTIFEQSILEN